MADRAFRMPEEDARALATLLERALRGLVWPSEEERALLERSILSLRGGGEEEVLDAAS